MQLTNIFVGTQLINRLKIHYDFQITIKNIFNAIF